MIVVTAVTGERSTEPRKGHFFSNIYQKRNCHKNIRKEIKAIISRLNDLSSFLSNIEQNRN